jgi:hypothetical protein
LYENRIVGDPTACCDSFQLKEKVADFFGEVRSESENFVLLGYFELEQRW